MSSPHNPLKQHAYHLLTQHFGTLQSFQALGHGQSQNVFAFKAAEQAWVLKISRNPQIAAKEHFAADWLKDLAVPKHHSSGSFGPYHWLIQAQISGEIIKGADWSQHFSQVIAFISQLRTSAFPIPLPPTGLSEWPDEIGAMTLWPQRFRHHLFWREEAALSQAIFDRVRQVLPTCPTVRWLIHGDFHPNNVLWQAGHISGVLDWQNLGNGDFLYDLALALIFCPESDWPKHMAEIAKQFEIPLTDVRQRIGLYALHGSLKRALGHREKLRIQAYQQLKQVLETLLKLPL